MALLDAPDEWWFNDDRRHHELKRYRLDRSELRRLKAALTELSELTTICATCGYSVHTTLAEGREWYRQHRREHETRQP